MNKFLLAAFLGLFFLGARPASADVVLAVPGVEVDTYHHHHHHHWHHYHHYHHYHHMGPGPVVIVHP
jgi:hypothetical protein